MSVHKSLKLKNKLVRRRNVLSREERVQRLKDGERWKEGDPVYGLPKVKVVIKAPKKKPKEAKPEGEAAPVEGEAAPAAAAAEPAKEKPKARDKKKE